MERWYCIDCAAQILFWQVRSAIDVQVQSLTIHCFIQHRGETRLTDDTSSHSTKLHFSQLFTKVFFFYHIWDEESLSAHRPFRLPPGSVRRLHSTLGRHTWCVCASLVCGREEETGWACSEDTLWEEGSAACCECFGSSEMEVRSSGSDRGRG